MKKIGILILIIAISCNQKKNSSESSQTKKVEPKDAAQKEETSTNMEEEITPPAASWDEVKIQQPEINGYHTHFVNNGRLLLYSRENFEGLWYYDFQSEKNQLITDQMGAGYQPQWVDGKIVFEVRARMKYLEAFNFDTKAIEPVESSKKSLSPMRYAQEIENKPSARLSGDLLGIEIINRDGAKKTLKPQPEGNYILASLSPNGKLLLYNVAGLGGFIADFNGKTLRELGDVDAPQWVNDDLVVYAKSKDDGMQILDSKVFVFDWKAEKKYPLNIDNVALFEPSVSRDGSQISAHSSDGNIYIFTKK
ncbi:MAG: hypothetical protein RIA69_08215 [Cyclobacteriaceae bacterium]